MKRRNFIKIAGTGTIASLITPTLLSCNTNPKTIPFTGHIFDELPYSYNALEPYIDAQTMELHYSKHHQGYFNKFTNEIKGTVLEKTPMSDIFKNISTYSEGIKNNGGGYYNHTLFWQNLSPEKSEPSNELITQIEKDFGSLEEFQKAFNNEAKTQFGSGWAWLVYTNEGKLKVGNTANQDNPLMPDQDIQGIPLIAFDVWEHAYYLKYQNKRTDYITAFWNIINWNTVNNRFNEASNIVV